MRRMWMFYEYKNQTHWSGMSAWLLVGFRYVTKPPTAI